MTYEYKLVYFGIERTFDEEYVSKGWEPVPHTVPVVRKDGSVHLWIRRDRNYDLVAR